MYKIKKIGVLSFAKFQAVLMALVGLIFGIFIAIIGAIIGGSLNVTGLGAGLGFFSIIVFPIIYGIFGFITGAIGALLYNLVAKWVGGIEIQLTQ